MLIQNHETLEKPGFVLRYGVRGARTYYRGAMLALDPEGWVVPLNPASPTTLRFVGVSCEYLKTDDVAPGVRNINVNKYGAMLYPPIPGFVPTQADLGKEVYAHSDGQVGLTPPATGQAIKVGVIVAREMNMVRIRIDGYVR